MMLPLKERCKPSKVSCVHCAVGSHKIRDGLGWLRDISKASNKVTLATLTCKTGQLDKLATPRAGTQEDRLEAPKWSPAHLLALGLNSNIKRDLA